MSQALRPLFVTVTWGAGGSTATKSLELAEICQRQLGLTTCMHLTCTNMSRALVDEALDEAKALGVRNILALRGDPPRSEEYRMSDHEDSNKDFTWAIDLVRYVRKVHGDYFCIGVAGYPEGHADGSHPEHQSVEQDLPYLVEKVKAGADFIMTQLTYDIEAYSAYEKTLRSHPSGIFASIPIIPGLMPIQSYQIVKRITNLSHARIPPNIFSRIEAVKTDDEAVKRVGVDILAELVDGINSLPQPQSLPRGFHFYTLNLEKSVAFILERCDLIPSSTEPTSPSTSGSESESAIVTTRNGPISMMNGVGDASRQLISRRRASSYNSQPHNRLIVDTEPTGDGRHRSRQMNGALSSQDSETHQASSECAGVPAGPSTRSNTLLISEGQGSLGREATWDDYPNGRWGPSSSPAFGEIDGYGPSLKVGPVAARQLWDHPKSPDDITRLFKKHVEGELVCVPWSDETDIASGGALRAETEVIRKELVTLIEGRGFWTLASQPAVNGVRSDDKVFGWGPPGEGFVFQKAFVEFFASRQSWEHELRPLLQRYDEDEISWLKTDSKGHFESSTSSKNLMNPNFSTITAGASGVNAVTWGVFRGKEIVTPTIIEEQSFRAWGEEAYGIWEEWRRVFPSGSEEEKFLESCKRESVLVNVVGQQFVGKGAARLWEILANGVAD
jgi:methylenetetrahydrofolate reductase (NADPH)